MDQGFPAVLSGEAHGQVKLHSSRWAPRFVPLLQFWEHLQPLVNTTINFNVPETKKG